MSRRRRGKKDVVGRTYAATSGLTPLVDVVFLLLLFLVLTARFVPREDRFEVRLPEREPPAVEQFLEPYRIALQDTESGPAIFAGGVRMGSVAELKQRLSELAETIPIVVVGEATVPYSLVVDAYDAAISVGRLKVTLGELGDAL
tara:strand:+ start:1726 stop:2160 length:435 start_codon:yes stop_codon:yes gene_type:complete